VPQSFRYYFPPYTEGLIECRYLYVTFVIWLWSISH